MIGLDNITVNPSIIKKVLLASDSCKESVSNGIPAVTLKTWDLQLNMH